MSDLLAQIQIVLVQPAGPRNLGSVARVMKNMGLRQLVLVDPRCDPFDPEARLMAVHAAELLHQAQVVASLPEALANCQRVVGTTGRPDAAYPPEWQIGSPRAVCPWLLGGGAGAIVFGPEDRGLSNGELALCQQQVRIPTVDAYPSLNLAQAVGICCYELRLMSLAEPANLGAPLAPVGLLEGFYEHLRGLLLQIGYLQPQTADRKLSKFRALFNRAQLTVPEVALLRGILRQLSWAQKTWDP